MTYTIKCNGLEVKTDRDLIYCVVDAEKLMRLQGVTTALVLDEEGKCRAEILVRPNGATSRTVTQKDLF